MGTVTVPDVSDMYIIQACVDGTFAEANSFFVAKLLGSLRRGTDIETAHKELVRTAKQLPTRLTLEREGHREVVVNYPVPEARSTLAHKFMVEEYIPRNQT